MNLWKNLHLAFSRISQSYIILVTIYFISSYIFSDRSSALAFLSNFRLYLGIPAIFLFVNQLKLRQFNFRAVLACGVTLHLFSIYITQMLPSRLITKNCDNDASITILSHNVGQHLIDEQKLLRLIEQHQPDLIFLQEAPGWLFEGDVSRMVDRYPYQFLGKVQGKARVRMAIFSRNPLSQQQEFRLDTEGLVVQQSAHVQLNKTSIFIANIHTTFPWVYMRLDRLLGLVKIPTYEDSIRRRELANLNKLLMQQTLPIILAGDFNMSDSSSDYFNLKNAGFVDAFRNVGFGLGNTWPANRLPSLNTPIKTPIFRPDYVFHTDDFDTCSAKIADRTGSDHLPILIIMESLSN